MQLLVFSIMADMNLFMILVGGLAYSFGHPFFVYNSGESIILMFGYLFTLALTSGVTLERITSSRSSYLSCSWMNASTFSYNPLYISLILPHWFMLPTKSILIPDFLMSLSIFFGDTVYLTTLILSLNPVQSMEFSTVFAPQLLHGRIALHSFDLNFFEIMFFTKLILQ